MEIPAVFRVWPQGDGMILFPTQPADLYGFKCDSWQPVGQHGSADYYGCIRATRPAPPELVASLTAQYEGYYNGHPGIEPFTLKLFKRATYAMHEACRAEARRFANA